MTNPVDPQKNLQSILESPSYRVAYTDIPFLTGPRMRAARMELELMKPELTFQDENIVSTVVVFGSTRIVAAEESRRQLERARAGWRSARTIPAWRGAWPRPSGCWRRATIMKRRGSFPAWSPSRAAATGEYDFVVMTGGGPGIMEAANRGASELGAKSIGLNIRLPLEQQPNPYITPDLCFQFRYFAIRKFHFVLRAMALVVFPGGFGTLDELFEVLTLRQTGRMQHIPVILVGREYWRRAVDFQFLADEGTVSDADLELFRFVDTRRGSVGDHPQVPSSRLNARRAVRRPRGCGTSGSACRG